MLSPWNQEQWSDPALSEHLVETVHKLGYSEKLTAILDAYRELPDKNLEAMKKATGNTVESSDVNYIWTSAGRMALMLELHIGDPKTPPHKKATYDDKLCAWVLDIEILYEEMMTQLSDRLENASSEDEEKEIANEIEKFDKKNSCDEADWKNGISVTPPKFYVVSEWIRKYFAYELSIANKIYFYKQSGTTAPPFVQVKVHRMCFFFKGRDGPGSVLVNPELAVAGKNELRDNLEQSFYDSQQFTVEVIDKGKAGKLTCLNDCLYVLPMAPRQVKKFDPQAADVKSDVDNAYLAFKNSHPDTVRSNSSGKCRVHVLRHGKVDNPANVFYGRMPGFGLHADGFQQAGTAGKYLRGTVADVSATIVVASPMLRAQQTAETVAKCLNEKTVVQTYDGVNEVRCPHEGKSMADMITINFAIYDDSGPEYETFEGVCQRVTGTLQKVVKDFPDAKDIVVVSHGDCVVASRLWGFGRDFTVEQRNKLQDEGYPTYCSVTTLEVTTAGQCRCLGTKDDFDAGYPDGKKV
jgi:broad specificity phosphatase PhoE